MPSSLDKDTGFINARVKILKANPDPAAYEIGGKPYPRIAYGREEFIEPLGDKLPPCHDCGVEEGRLHVRGCDAEYCPRCHRQAIFCPCPYDEGKGK